MISSLRRGIGCLLALGLFGGALYFLLPTKLMVSPTDALTAGESLLSKKRVVVFAAHPDDADWWMSGTAARLSASGARIRLVVASDGERGRNRNGGTDGLGKIRRQEQRNASKILGYAEVSFLGLPDRGIADEDRLMASIRKVIEQEQPDAIFSFDGGRPSLPYLHPDHESLGRRVERIWRELDSEATLFRFHSRQPNVAVDIGNVIDTKIAAMMAHKSQVGEGRADGIRRRASGQDLVGVKYAEFFRKTEPNE